jgi:hypothetical protein
MKTVRMWEERVWSLHCESDNRVRFVAVAGCDIEVLDDLAGQVANLLKVHPTSSWDKAIARIVLENRWRS